MRICTISSVRVKAGLRAFLFFAGIAVCPSVSLASGDAWGPLEAGKCADETGRREMSARLWSEAAGADLARRCEVLTRDVMGRESKPQAPCRMARDAVSEEVYAVGRWLVSDSTCGVELPVSPARGESGALKSAAPLEGYADIHVHQMAHLGFGGSVIWGGAFGDRREVLNPIPEAMKRGHDITDDATNHRIFRTLANAFIGHIFRHGESGSPTFSDWPAHNQMTHQQVYEDWLFRAYQGGMRLMVMLAENSEDMFGRGENSFPLIGKVEFQPVKADGRTGNDMEALEWQIREAHLMQAHVDEKYKGLGKEQGWYRIVRDSAEASKVVGEGRLAVVLGAEIQHLFNCDMDRPACTKETIVEGLNRLEGMGIRYVFPVHHKLNQFGGPARFQPVNNGPVEPCPEYTQPCSAVGLTDLGRFLVEELMARGMMIDTEHLSRKAFDDVVEIAERYRYPLMASHVVPYNLLATDEQTERSRTSGQLKKLLDLGGVVAPLIGTAAREYSGGDAGTTHVPITCNRQDGGSVDQWANAYLYVRNLANGGISGDGGVIAFGSDWNGVAGWPGPRHAEGDPCPKSRLRDGKVIPVEGLVPYPIKLPEGLIPSKIGGSTVLNRLDWPDLNVQWDYNKRGMAHVGMMPEFLENLRVLGLTPADLESLYRSARGVVNLWRRIQASGPAQARGMLRWVPQYLFDVLPEAIEAKSGIRNVTFGTGSVPICRMRDGRKLGYERDNKCHPVQDGALRESSESERTRISAYHAGRCMAVERDSLEAGEKVTQRRCDSMASQLWKLENKGERVRALRNANSGLCLTVGHVPDGSGVGVRQQPCSGAEDQSWQTTRVGNTFQLLSVGYGRCLEVRDQSREEGAELFLTKCSTASNQLWTIEALRQDDYELLQSVAGSVAWYSNSDAVPTNAVVAAANDLGPVCTFENDENILGIAIGGVCSGRSQDGVSQQSKQFKLLVSTFR